MRARTFIAVLLCITADTTLQQRDFRASLFGGGNFGDILSNLFGKKCGENNPLKAGCKTTNKLTKKGKLTFAILAGESSNNILQLEQFLLLQTV